MMMVMTKKSASVSVATWCLAGLMVLLVAEVHETAAVNCNLMELIPCQQAITGNQPPSSDCCNKLKEQVPCFCGYLKNPVLRPYIESPNAKKVAGICKVPQPKC